MESLIASIRAVLDRPDRMPIDISELKRLLEGYKPRPADWQRYAHFHPHKYTRNMVDTGNGKYNLLLLCWSAGTCSTVHDHTNSHCFVKVLTGSLLETRYAWPDKVTEGGGGDEVLPLVEIGRDLYSTNGVAYMSDEIGLHRMENPSHSDPTVTLHCYTPPFEQCRAFDLRTGHSSETTMTFDTHFGKKTIDHASSSDERRMSG